MAKKKLDKEAESTPSSPSKIVAVCKNETVHFVIGLMLVIFPFTCCWLFLPSSLRGLPIKVLLIAVVRRIWRLLIIR